MAGYTPVFSSIFDGTLHGKWPQTGVWLALLAMTDRHGCIDRTPQAIASDVGISAEELLVCIGEFCKPDPMSRTQECEGRRLVLIDPARSWGWRVVNHSRYREKARLQARDSSRTESGADASRKRTERESPDVPRSPPRSPSPDSDSDSDANKEKNKKPDRRTSRAVDEPAEFVLVRQEYPKRAGGQRWGDALKFFQRRVREGEKVEVIVEGVKRYAAYARATGLERTEKVQQAATFLGDNRGYLELWQPPPRAMSAVERIQSRMRNGASDERVVSEQGGASLEPSRRLLR
jgi:hypothetical protein